MDASRRAFCRRAGAVLTLGGIGGLSATTGAAAASVPEFDPSNVATADYPEQLLRDYQPALDSSQAARSALVGIYAWRATPADDAPVDTEALYYWFKYSHQESFLGDLFRSGGPDAHLGDHEPVIVFRDPDSGAVERVVCSGYHHFAAERQGDDVSVLDDDPTHPRLKIVDPWHHYNFLDDGQGTAGLLEPTVGLENWLDVRNGWYNDGVFTSSSVAAVDDPYVMLDRDMWWRNGTREDRLYGLWLSLGLDVNLGGAIASPAQADDDLRV